MLKRSVRRITIGVVRWKMTAFIGHYRSMENAGEEARTQINYKLLVLILFVKWSLRKAESTLD